MPKKIENFQAKKILLCQLRQIGDVIISTAVVEIIAKAYPKAEIHFFTEKKCAPMLLNNPNISKVWPLDKKKMPTLLHELSFYRKVAQSHFDLVIDFQKLPRCRWVVAFSRAKYRLCTESSWYNHWLYTHSTIPEKNYAGAFKAQILKPLGLAWNGEKPRIYLSNDEIANAKAMMHSLGFGNKKLISVDITHRHATRCWPTEYYAKMLDMLAESEKDYNFFIPFGPGEEKDVERLKSSMKYKERLCIPDSLINLRSLAAGISLCSMHIGNCSAPRHMAAALDIPSLSILGSTSDGWTFPAAEHSEVFAGLTCQPCNKNTCPIDIKCLKDLSPEKVFTAAKKHLNEFTLG